MKYIGVTRNLPLILSVNGSSILKWWVGGSLAVYPNMIVHAGGGLSMVRGVTNFSSTNNKLNTQSFTETEIVAVDDFMPAILWTLYWLDSQGNKTDLLYKNRI